MKLTILRTFFANFINRNLLYALHLDLRNENEPKRWPHKNKHPFVGERASTLVTAGQPEDNGIEGLESSPNSS
jgi:hypothetical protein